MVTNDIRKPLPETIDDLYKLNYTICAPKAELLENFLNDQDFIDQSRKPNLQFVAFDDFNSHLFENVQNSSLKTAFFAQDEIILTSQKGICGNRFKEDYYTLLGGMNHGRNYFLFDVMEKTVQRILPAGIYEHFKDMEFWRQRRKNAAKYKKIERGDKLLKMKDLKFMIMIWLVTLGVASGVFVGEVLIKTSKKMLSNLIGLFFVLNGVTKVVT